MKPIRSKSFTAIIATVALGTLSAACTHHHHQQAGQSGHADSMQVRTEPPNTPIQPMGVPESQKGLTVGQATKIIEIDTDPSNPGFSPGDFTVHPGEIVSLTLRNRGPQAHQHALIITRPGKADEVAQSATRSGPSRDWRPSLQEAPNVIAETKVLSPGESDSITFRAPSQPGDYPFICPVTRQWTVMHGVMHVKG